MVLIDPHLGRFRRQALHGTVLLDANGGHVAENKILIRVVPQKAISSWLAKADEIPAEQKKDALQSLVSEGFVTTIQSNTGLTNFRIIGCDIKAFSQSDDCNSFFIKIAMASKYKFLRGMAEAAFTLDDSTFFVALLHLMPESSLFEFLSGYLERGIEQCSSESEVLRADWVETALIKAWSAKNWRQLVGNTQLSESIRHIMRVPWAFQLNPSDMDFPTMLEGNILTVRRVVTDILQALVSILQEGVPPFFANVSLTLRALVEAKFEGANGSEAVGTLLVLRGITPAIISPHVYGLAPAKPDPQASKALLTVARVVQQAANGQPFPESSDFACLNDMLVEMGVMLTSACNGIGRGDVQPLSTSLSPLVRHAAVSVSKRLMWHNDSLRQRLKLRIDDPMDPRLDISNQTFDAICGRLLYRFAKERKKKPTHSSREGNSRTARVSRGEIGGLDVLPSAQGSSGSNRMVRSESQYSMSSMDDDSEADFFDSSNADDGLALAAAVAAKLVEMTEKGTDVRNQAEMLHSMLNSLQLESAGRPSSGGMGRKTPNIPRKKIHHSTAASTDY